MTNPYKTPEEIDDSVSLSFPIFVRRLWTVAAVLCFFLAVKNLSDGLSFVREAISGGSFPPISTMTQRPAVAAGFTAIGFLFLIFGLGKKK